MPKRDWRVYLALFTVALIYGANYSIAKSLMPDFIGPGAFVLLRILGAFLFFSLFHSIRIKEKISDRKDYFYLLLCALFGVVANMTMFFYGLELTSPINASVIMTINPVIVLLASAILMKEKVTLRKTVGIALGMTGAILQIMDPFGVAKRIEGINWVGDLLVMGNAASYAIYLVLVRKMMLKYKAMTVVKWTFTFGLIMMVPIGFMELIQVDWSSFTLDIGLRLGFVLVGTTILAYLLNAWSLKHVSSTVVGAFIYLQPILATFIALVFAGYEATWHLGLYAALIFIGVYLVSVKSTRLHGKNTGN